MYHVIFGSTSLGKQHLYVTNFWRKKLIYLNAVLYLWKINHGKPQIQSHLCECCRMICFFLSDITLLSVTKFDSNCDKWFSMEMRILLCWIFCRCKFQCFEIISHLFDHLNVALSKFVWWVHTWIISSNHTAYNPEPNWNRSRLCKSLLYHTCLP